jgi:hypothetical protein
MSSVINLGPSQSGREPENWRLAPPLYQVSFLREVAER